MRAGHTIPVGGAIGGIDSGWIAEGVDEKMFTAVC